MTTVMRAKLYAPTLWTCPRCDTRVRTHVDTYPVECRHKSHHRDMVMMVPEEATCTEQS